MGLFDKLKQFLLAPFSSGGNKRRGSRKKKARSVRRKTLPKKTARTRAVKPSRRRPSQAPNKPLTIQKTAVKRSPKSSKKTAPRKAARVLKKNAPVKAVLRVSKKSAVKAGTAAPRLKASKPAAPSQPGLYVGALTHYFAKVKAAVIPLEETLKVGDKIWIGEPGGEGFRQAVKSLQINRIPIDEGRPGEEVGLEVLRDVRVGDKVFKLKAAG